MEKARVTTPSWSPQPCSSCDGKRLRPESLAVRVADHSIAHLTELSVTETLETVRQIQLSERDKIIAGRIVDEVIQRLEFLESVGLGYLSLARPATTLSGGEGQRIRLATQIGSRLRGVLYVLDEPSIGLHPRDNQRLLGMLEQLRDLGNTVIVVEHDEETIRRADYCDRPRSWSRPTWGRIDRLRDSRRSVHSAVLVDRTLSGRRPDYSNPVDPQETKREFPHRQGCCSEQSKEYRRQVPSWADDPGNGSIWIRKVVTGK